VVTGIQNNTRRVPTYCNNCVAGPDLMTVVVGDGVALAVEPNHDGTDLFGSGGRRVPFARR